MRVKFSQYIVNLKYFRLPRFQTLSWSILKSSEEESNHVSTVILRGLFFLILMKLFQGNHRKPIILYCSFCEDMVIEHKFRFKFDPNIVKKCNIVGKQICRVSFRWLTVADGVSWSSTTKKLLIGVIKSIVFAWCMFFFVCMFIYLFFIYLLSELFKFIVFRICLLVIIFYPYVCLQRITRDFYIVNCK